MKKVLVELRWDDAKALAEFLTEILEENGATLRAPKGGTNALIERVIMEIACAYPVMPDVEKKTTKKKR